MNGGKFISSPPPRFRIQVALHENPRVGFLTALLDSGLRRNDGRSFGPRQNDGLFGVSPRGGLNMRMGQQAQAGPTCPTSGRRGRGIV
jgi:hypothetical protein